MPAGWVAADEAYGQDYKFRTWREQYKIGYVVAVPRSHAIPLPPEADFRSAPGGQTISSPRPPDGRGSAAQPRQGEG